MSSLIDKKMTVTEILQYAQRSKKECANDVRHYFLMRDSALREDMERYDPNESQTLRQWAFLCPELNVLFDL